MSDPPQEILSPIKTFEELGEWLCEEREGILHAYLLYDVHLVAFGPLSLTLRLSDRVPSDFAQRLQGVLKEKRGEIWTIAISEEMGQPTLQEKEEKTRELRRQAIGEDPLVKMLVNTFPGAKLIEKRDD